MPEAVNTRKQQVRGELVSRGKTYRDVAALVGGGCDKADISKFLSGHTYGMSEERQLNIARALVSLGVPKKHFPELNKVA